MKAVWLWTKTRSAFLSNGTLMPIAGFDVPTPERPTELVREPLLGQSARLGPAVMGP
jgi:hypothetical protein